MPEELQQWIRRCPGIRPITSQNVVDGVYDYPMLGVDRALAVRGAAHKRLAYQDKFSFVLFMKIPSKHTMRVPLLLYVLRSLHVWLV